MKKLIKTTFALVITAAIAFTSLNVTTYAATAEAKPSSETFEIKRTRPWDGINNTLGGVPESVRKIEHKGSIFYLAPDVSDNDFTAVLAVGPEAVRLKTPVDNGTFYQYPVYIIWNSDKTVLLVHPIIFDYDNILEAVAKPTAMPSIQTETQTTATTPKKALRGQEAIDYMLTDEYADAVRTEFYRLLNEHRKANGLRELEVNLELQDYADVRADEQRTKFGHTRPDGSYAGSGWYNSYNHLNSRYAENALSCGAVGADPHSAARGIFSIWKNSKGHNRHMLYDFDSRITMALGIAPKLDEDGFVTTGAIFATGF